MGSKPTDLGTRLRAWSSACSVRHVAGRRRRVLEDSDPLWEGLLSPVLKLAESLPYKIAQWVGRNG